MAVYACFTSGSKGGVGKTTLSSLLTLALAAIERRVLLVDCSEDGGASRLLLGNPEPPYLRDVLSGEVPLLEAIAEYEVEIGGRPATFYMISNAADLPESADASLLRGCEELEAGVDVVVFDLPAFRRGDGLYRSIVDLCDVVVKVSAPSHTDFACIAKSYPPPGSGRRIVYVVNQPRLYARSWIGEFEEYVRASYGSEVVVFPYDKVVPFMRPDKIGLVLDRLSREFVHSLVSLAYSLLTPRRREVVA